MPEQGAIRVTVAGATDVGQIREHNEDNLLVADLTAGERSGSGDSISSREIGGKGLLVAVADGMGGAASGELASEMAVDTVYEQAAEAGIDDSAEMDDVARNLAACLTVANTRIFDKSQAESEHRGMGTTMTAVHAMGAHIAIAQVGDSRAYLLRKGKLVQVTKDQSLIEQLIQEGTLTEEEAERLGGRNIILQALGVEEGVTVDTKTMEVLDGDLLILCSDGLSGMIKDDTIEATVNETEDIGAACGRLIAQANEAGGRDNITVILVRFEGEGLRAPMKPLEAEDGESAPQSFAPPEIPETTPSRSRPLLYGMVGLALVLIAFFLLTGGSGEVTLNFPAPGVTGELSPTEGDGEPLKFQTAAGEKSYTVSDLAPGRWTLIAKHDDYRALETVIEVKSGKNPMDVDLKPLPGRVFLSSELAHVTVRLESRNPDGAVLWHRERTLEGSEPVEVKAVPAGPIFLQVSRKTFETRHLEEVLPPNGDLNLPLTALTAIQGALKVICPEPGFELVILDSWGEKVFGPRTLDSDLLDEEVRVGEHTLTAKHPKYQEFATNVTIVAETGLTVRVQAVKKQGSVIAIGPSGARVFVDRPDGEPAGRGRIPEGEDRVTIPRLPPGTYEVRLAQPGKPTERRTVTVKPAAETTVEFQR